MRPTWSGRPVGKTAGISQLGFVAGAIAFAAIAGAAVGAGHGLEALTAASFVGVTALAATRAGIALCLVVCVRFVTDIYGNNVSTSPATAVATVITLWVCTVALLTHLGTFRQFRIAVFVPYAALVAWVAYRGLGVPWAGDAGLEIAREVGQWSTYLAIFIAGAVTLGSPTSLRNVARLIAFAAIVQVAISFGQLVAGMALEYGAYSRSYGTFPHPSWLAFFLAVAVVALPSTQWSRSTQVTIGALFLGGIVGTSSRGALVFLFVWAVVSAFIGRRPKIAVGATVTAGMLLLIPMIRDRFLGEIGSFGQLTGSYESRTLLRNVAIDLWQQSPWQGHGTAAFFAHYSPTYFDGQAIEAHSDIFKLLADQGVIGLALYLAVLTIVYRVVRYCDVPGRTALASLVVTLPIMGVLDVYYRMNTAQAFLWLLLGSAVGLGLRRLASDTQVPSGSRV